MPNKEMDVLPPPSRLGKAGLTCGIISLALLAFFVVAAPIATAQFANVENSEPARAWQELAVLAFVGFSASGLISFC